MVYDYLFTSQFQIWIFCYTFPYFVSFGDIENRVTKVNFKYFNGSFEEAWLFEKFIFEVDASSYSFKITCILSRQVISLKMIMVSSAIIYCFNVMVSYLYSFNPLKALMKLASTTVAIIYKSIENWQPWKTSRVRWKDQIRGYLF